MFTKYIPDSDYHNSEENSEAAARALRDEILEALQTRSAEDVFAEYRAKYAKPKKPGRKTEEGAEGDKGNATI